jgi:hypothetical protein
MSRRGKDEANPDPQIADVLPLAALDERVAIVGASGRRRRKLPRQCQTLRRHQVDGYGSEACLRLREK